MFSLSQISSKLLIVDAELMTTNKAPQLLDLEESCLPSSTNCKEIVAA